MVSKASQWADRLRDARLTIQAATVTRPEPSPVLFTDGAGAVWFSVSDEGWPVIVGTGLMAELRFAEIEKFLASARWILATFGEIECASCHKTPLDDPKIALQRMNITGVAGVWLCGGCVGP